MAPTSVETGNNHHNTKQGTVNPSLPPSLPLCTHPASALSSIPLPSILSPHGCRTAFNEYQLCVEARGRNDLTCLQRGRDYATVCPDKWVDDWKSDLEKGVSMSVGKAFVKGE